MNNITLSTEEQTLLKKFIGANLKQMVSGDWHFGSVMGKILLEADGGTAIVLEPQENDAMYYDEDDIIVGFAITPQQGPQKFKPSMKWDDMYITQLTEKVQQIKIVRDTITLTNADGQTQQSQIDQAIIFDCGQKQLVFELFNFMAPTITIIWGENPVAKIKSPAQIAAEWSDDADDEGTDTADVSRQVITLE